LLITGCEDTIYNTYDTDPRFFNDAFHGHIIGKVKQKNSNARIVVSQVNAVDSTVISASDGSFIIENLEIGNYDLKISADNFRTYLRTNIMIEGAGTTYLGEIDLSKVPDLVSSHYPADLDEIVFDNRSSRLSISMIFTRPMDRQSVEEAFSTDPPTDGIFYWGQYSQAPSWRFFENDYKTGGFDPGATITTYSKITSFTYRVTMKDSYVDTTYNVTLATSAKDTAGNALRFPLEYSFSTIQSSQSINGIQTFPYHGDVDVALISKDGIQITFPRNMEPVSTEAAITMFPDVDHIFIWPQKNQLTIYSGGPFLSETDYKIDISEMARDLDDVKLGNPFSFSFSTESIKVNTTSPRNGELFVDYSQPRITMWFNTYMIKSSVENAFSISPSVAGTFSWGSYYNTDKTAITFTPSSWLTPNTKYTVTLNNMAKDLYGDLLKEPYSFSFITRPE
jgi:hypothetical protein